MLGKGKPFDIQERTFEFAVRVLEVTSRLPQGPEGDIVRSQLAGAGTSVGANTEEANGAISRKERRKYLGIARREARESRYWLRIIRRRWQRILNVEGDVKEATEIKYILSAMIAKLDAA